MNGVKLTMPKPARTRGAGAVTVAPIARGELLAITDGEATTIRIDRGEVWISEEGSYIDHVLCAGQAYTVESSGVALVAAQKDSRVTLFAPRVGPPPARIAVAGQTVYARSLWRSVVALLFPVWTRQPSRRAFAG
jgi:hypothetical protein